MTARHFQLPQGKFAFRGHLMRTVALSIAVILLSIATAPAQTSRGTVSGFVTDPSDAVVGGANVKLTNIQTSVSRETKTNEDGIYRFDAVDLGTYTLTLSAPGFGTVEKTNVTVNANLTSTADAKLQLAGQQVTIDVFAEVGAALQTEAPVRGGNISQTEVTELPYSSRNPTAIALTLPGVSSNRGSFALSSFSVNGARDR